MDLNLLRSFVAVFETRSLTAAAERLFVSQPAVSQALVRLRRELDDELFIRAGRGMEPTRVAESLYPEFSEALDRVDRAVDGVRGFDPRSSTRSFRIAMSELGELGFLPAIAAELKDSAPGVTLEVRPLDVSQLPDWLSRGAVDLAITSSKVTGDFAGTVIRTQPYSVVMAPEHPLAALPALALDEYLAADHVVVATDSGEPSLTAALGSAGIPPAHLRVNHFSSLPALLSRGDLLATVPTNLATGWLHSWGVVVRDLPIDMMPVRIRLYKRSTNVHAAALTWLHQVVLDVCVAVGRDRFEIGGGTGQS